MPDQSSQNAYQAAITTRDRSLAARQESIDILKRMIADMNDDPNMIKLQENLQKILEHPEVITDEVFANIMSKTNEVLDSNYETQVQDLINTAKSSGISGPALQVQLQRAKEARATAMTGALRDAIVQRSQEGLTTNISAVQTAANTLTQLLQSKASMTQQLVNEINQIVEEPFQNAGPAALPQAAGGGGSKPITMDFSGVSKFGEPTPEEAAAAQAAQQKQAASNAETDAMNARARQFDAQLNAQMAANGMAARGTPGATPTTPTAPNAVVQPITPDSIGKTETRTFGPGENVDMSKAPDTEVPLDVYLRRLKGRDILQAAPGIAGTINGLLTKIPEGASGITDTFKGLQGALDQFSQIGNGVKSLFAGNTSTPVASTGPTTKQLQLMGVMGGGGGSSQPDGTYSTPNGDYTLKNGVMQLNNGRYAATDPKTGLTTMVGKGTPEASGIEFSGGANEAVRAGKLSGELIGTSSGAGVYDSAPKANPYGTTAAAQSAYAAKLAAKKAGGAATTSAPASSSSSGGTGSIGSMQAGWDRVKNPEGAGIPIHYNSTTGVWTDGLGAAVGGGGGTTTPKAAATPAPSTASSIVKSAALGGPVGAAMSVTQKLMQKFFGGN